jgi:hypothetical protein
MFLDSAFLIPAGRPIPSDRLSGMAC